MEMQLTFKFVGVRSGHGCIIRRGWRGCCGCKMQCRFHPLEVLANRLALAGVCRNFIEIICSKNAVATHCHFLHTSKLIAALVQDWARTPTASGRWVVSYAA